MKFKGFMLWFLVAIILLLIISNSIGIERNRRVINTLREQQGFLDDILYETVKTQSSILRTQRIILEILDTLIQRGE